MDVRIRKSNLKGDIVVPPSKSLSHRMLLASSLSKNPSTVSNLIFSEDINATISCLSKLGSKFSIHDSSVTIEKCAIEGGVLDASESGSTLRFLIPVSISLTSRVEFIGRGKLPQRPLGIYFDIFDKQNIAYEKGIDELPLKINGRLKSGEFHIPGDISSQFITGLLYALPLLDGDSKIIITTNLESKGYVDLTLDTLNIFGIKIINNDYKEFIIPGNQEYKAVPTVVEGDFSQAAFFLVADALGADLNLLNMNKDSHQGDKEIIDFLRKMGIECLVTDEKIKAFAGNSKGTVIDLAQAPDLGPIITVLAALSEGKTEIIHASRLRIKECDRIKAITTELNKLGARIKETDDGMIIEGVKMLHGGTVDSWNDHRIAMSLAIASLKTEGDIVIKNAQCIKKSFPHFFKVLESVGGDISYE